MSLFDLQDICIAIGSIATLDLPMVVDLIGIYGLKGPYCTLTTTNCNIAAAPSPHPHAAAALCAPPPPRAAGKLFPSNLDEENPSAPISSGLIVQADEGIPSPVMDLIDDIYRRLPVFQQGLETNSFVDYFSDSSVQPVLQNVPDIESLSSDGSLVYRSPSSQSDLIFDQDDLMDFHANSDSDEQTSDHQFDLPVSTTIVGSTPVVAPLSIPATDITESFAQLHASIEDIRFEQIRRKDDTDRLRDIQDLRAVLSLDLSTYQKKLSTQVAATALDNVDVRKEVKALNAKVTFLDEQVAAMRNDLLNFHAKAEENHLNLSTELGLLVDYINRGGDAKKGKSGSSQLRPPPDDQSRPSGGGGTVEVSV
ncbi:hypothetical protein F511_22852 [Dorcoceras hygrometricum]|uniref:Uncharacterized protein n=1 Tax=Dorcoceras hygrometricum TaxID=472368 RepID=A0A2Z7BX52_9LAMI|nr:hypothetical protein F511_22852 [Dorcoceras hygrometricum]